MRSRIAVCAVLIVVAAHALTGAVGRPAQSARLMSVNEWVTLYERDPLDASIRLGQLAENDIYKLRDTFMGAAKNWPQNAPPLHDPLLTLAALVVEIERVRVDTNDWREIPGHNAGAFAVARAAELIERRGKADDGAHAWWRVVLTLGEANHDRIRMFKPLMSHPPVRFDFLDRAMAMFPGDVGFRLSEARLHAAGISALPELNLPSSGLVQMQAGAFVLGMGYRGAASRTQIEELEAARRLLPPLFEDPTVGADAHFWFGVAQWLAGELADARDTISGVARINSTTDVAPRDIRYTAAVFLGYIDEALGRVNNAVADFQWAFGVRPNSQTASFALAALYARAGDAPQAERLVNAALGPRGSDDDPWRTMMDGDLPHLSAQLDDLRRAVKGAAQ